MALIVMTACVFSRGFAGEGATEIPDRFLTLRPGDWFLFRADGKTVRETCFLIDGNGADRVVYHTVENLDGTGEIHWSGWKSVSFRAHAERLAIYRDALTKSLLHPERLEKEIGGKAVEVYRVAAPVNPFWTELWLSDRLSTQGVVMMKGGGVAGQPRDIEPLDFGNWFDASPDDIVIPVRGMEKLRAGDWFLSRENGVLTRETIVGFEAKGDDTLIRCRIERMDGDGVIVETEEDVQSLVNILASNCLENIAMRTRGEKSREVMTIGDRTIDVVAVRADDGDESWYSESAALFGPVRMIQRNSRGEVAWSIEPVAFGSFDTE